MWLGRNGVMALTALLLFGSLAGGCTTRHGEPLGGGPHLLPEDEARSLAISQGVLADITECYLQTSGPIYRVLRGHDKSGRDCFVWIDLGIVHTVPAEAGVSREEILDKAKPFSEAGHLVHADLVYIPPELKAYPTLEFICQSPGNVFWWVRVCDDQQQPLASLWYSFENGEYLGK